MGSITPSAKHGVSILRVLFMDHLKTKEYVNECFTYVDGKLYWKHRPLYHFTSEVNQRRFNSMWAGKEAGYVNKRTDSKREGFAYHRVRLWGKLQKTHRVIFLMFNGYLPELIDHIDNNPLNNRIENLRESDVVKNKLNSMPNYNMKTKGVMFYSKLKVYAYKVTLSTKDTYYYIGNFKTESEAQAAYNIAGEYLFGLEHFRPVPTDFTGNVRNTSFFKKNNISTEYKPA